MNDRCNRCEFDFGGKRDDGTVVKRDKEYDEHCTACAVIVDNAAEQAWIDRENDRFFGGGQ